MLLRTSSEDVLTATVFSILKNISPEKWLTDWLNESFSCEDFSEARFENLTFEMWPSLSPPPGLNHREGSSRPDLLITFDDVVVIVEAKYMAELSSGTANHTRRNQLVRFADVAYHHFSGQLFPRRVYLMTLTLVVPELVERYSKGTHLVRDLSQFGCSQEAAEAIARVVRIGGSTWDALAGLLASRLDGFQENPVEEAFVLDLLSYLVLKTTQIKLKDTAARGV